jgi:hypothetical protein
MPNLTHTIAVGLTALACLQTSASGVAEDRDGNPIALESPASAQLNLLGVRPIDVKVLANQRGGTDVTSDMLLKGVVADNRATNVTTGNNLITEGAFAGASGMPMVIQNSGNNVLIQNATIVNVQLK